MVIPYGKRLIELRGNKSQTEVAKDIGIATSTLGMYETQQRIPRDTALGTIPSYAYQNYCEMYAAYHELGGNGMVTKMKQEIEELHIKRKGE